jgi:hypothetical protein
MSEQETAEIVARLLKDLDELIIRCEKGDISASDTNWEFYEKCEEAMFQIKSNGGAATEEHAAQAKQRWDKLSKMADAEFDRVYKPILEEREREREYA